MQVAYTWDSVPGDPAKIYRVGEQDHATIYRLKNRKYSGTYVYKFSYKFSSYVSS